MSGKSTSELIISTVDYTHLMQLIEKTDTSAADALDEEISRAKVVDTTDLPKNTVTMNSLVTFSDIDSKEEKTVQLVYPQEADINQLKISILSPVGSALIGLSLGGAIEWPIPQGKFRRLKVIAVKQPQ
ncbi:nucleoside diphosphate kinase regulator [Cellvibrio sp. pealriver]|uniref:nucleoside diphosphate kinase regulator n=1 Tax=Cellvibrio sp. pealriver TaxID=1622269 RepID=UPI00066FE0E5|nr:nucleoside diphosphate kinase regulator [Cellvibrio sp. pealriver]